ncbi:hypothetical protein FGB62_22g541 [Gracilaria domingensis]|nr:hypothetical protein FGB62_22g541 [Gracilaria domingensis]
MGGDPLEDAMYAELEAQSSRVTLPRTADDEGMDGPNTSSTQAGTLALSLQPAVNQQRLDAQQETDKPSERKTSALAHVSSSTYKPTYTPLIVVPNEEAKRREQQKRRDELILERFKKRQLQLLQNQENTETTNRSENGYDNKGIWRFLGTGILMGFVLSFFSFVLLCCHEFVGLRGGRINSFVIGVFVGMFLASIVTGILIVRYVDVERFCNPVNEITATSLL